MVLFMAIATGCTRQETASSWKEDVDALSKFSDAELEALDAAQDFIRSEFAFDAEFQSKGTIIEKTQVADRYKVLQRFDSEIKDGHNMVYRMWVQKFPSGWEYGNLGIEQAGGERVFTTNGRMKEMEQKDGIGDVISAGGVEFIIAEKKPTVIRIYTDHKLSREQLRAAIVDLIDRYDSIQFATTANHERGDEYASWTADMFFDYDTDEIIGKSKFFQ